jgi:hypothetical protein
MIYKIFISHIGEDEDEYSIFIQKLSSAHNFEYENCGIMEDMSDKGIEGQIKPVGVVIILSGLYNKYKSIIKKQLNISIDLDKPVIVIRPYGMEDVPSELDEIAEDIVGWNAACIVDSIEEFYQE